MMDSQHFRNTKEVVALLEAAGWRVRKYGFRKNQPEMHEADFFLGPTKILRPLRPGLLRMLHAAQMGRIPPRR
jgi:hypothetical protein